MRAYIISVVGTGWCCCCLCRQEGSDLHICKKKKKGNFPTCFTSLEDHFNGDPKRCPRYLVNILLKNSWNYRQRNRGKRRRERMEKRQRKDRRGKDLMKWNASLCREWLRNSNNSLQCQSKTLFYLDYKIFVYLQICTRYVKYFQTEWKIIWKINYD